MLTDPNKLLVIYIPKNGALCIPWKQLNGTTEENPTITEAREKKIKANGNYETFLHLKSNLNMSDYEPITIVRNPFTRTYSLYNHYFSLTKGGKKLDEPSFYLTKDLKPFINFLNQIKYNKPFHPNSRGLVPKTQSYFLKNENNVIDSLITIFKHENLNQLKEFLNVDSLVHSNKKRFDTEAELDEFCNRYKDEEPGFSQSKFLKKKNKFFYSLSEMQENYTQECIDLVKEIYAEDFDNFGYSRNFDDCLN